jgi:hypothetical protein
MRTPLRYPARFAPWANGLVDLFDNDFAKPTSGIGQNPRGMAPGCLRPNGHGVAARRKQVARTTAFVVRVFTLTIALRKTADHRGGGPRYFLALLRPKPPVVPVQAVRCPLRHFAA